MRSLLTTEQLTLRLGEVAELVASRNILSIEHNARKDFEIKYASTSGHRWELVERTVPSSQFEKDIVGVFQRIIKAQCWRPKRLKIFVNHRSGKNNGREIYSDEVARIFRLANIETDVIESNSAEEAREYLVGANLEMTDGVICVGGDGTFWAVASGVLERTQLNARIDMDVENQTPAKPKIRLGAIPGGSFCCIASDSVGTASPITSALHIALGYSHQRDVMTVSNADTNTLLGYATLIVNFVAGYAKVATIEAYLRPLFGPARYIVGVIVRVLLGRDFKQFKYHTKMIVGGVSQEYCFRNCHTCGIDEGKSSSYILHGLVEEQHKGYAGMLWLPTSKSITNINPEGIFPFSHVADGTMSLNCFRKSPAWEGLIGSFYLIIFNKENLFVKGLLKTIDYSRRYLHKAEFDFSDSKVVPDIVLDGEVCETKQPLKRVRVNVHRRLLSVFGAGSDGTIDSWSGKPDYFDVPYLRKIIFALFIVLLLFIFLVAN